VLAFENSGAVARYAAQQAIIHGGEIDPDAAIAAIDSVTFGEVAEVAAGISENLAIACVGPHAAADF
jgi:predicted Zn-dependent peptidase